MANNEQKAKKIVDSIFSTGFNIYKTFYEMAYNSAMEMAEWKDKEFWSLDNIEKIIVTYKSFPDRSCPSELVKKTIEKLKQ